MALNSAIKIERLILKEEATWEGIHSLNTAKYLENMLIQEKPHIKHIKDYMEQTYLKTWPQHHALVMISSNH